jgi:hypothetical protein
MGNVIMQYQSMSIKTYIDSHNYIYLLGITMLEFRKIPKENVITRKTTFNISFCGTSPKLSPLSIWSKGLYLRHAINDFIDPFLINVIKSIKPHYYTSITFALLRLENKAHEEHTWQLVILYNFLNKI